MSLKAQLTRRPQRRALGRDTAITFPPVKRCMIAGPVPPARFSPKLTRTWKLNNYRSILRPSSSNSQSSKFPPCCFPFCMRDPSVLFWFFLLLEMHLLIFQALLFSPRYCLKSLKHSNEHLTSSWNGLKFSSEHCQRLDRGSMHNLSRTCRQKFESKALSLGIIILRTGSHFNKGGTTGGPDQESEKP